MHKESRVQLDTGIEFIQVANDLLHFLPESIKGIAAGFNEYRAVVILVVV